MFEGIAALFSLGLLGAILLLLIGIVVPNVVLPGEDRSRIDAVKLYLSLCIFTLFAVYFFNALEKGAVVGIAVNGAISLFGGYAAFRTWTGLTQVTVDGTKDSAKKQEEPRPQRAENQLTLRIDSHVPVRPADEPEEELPPYFVPERMFIESGVSTTGEEPITTRQDIQKSPPAVGSSEFTWAGTDCTIVIDKFRIRDPLTYWSNGTPRYNEASCLYTSLPVGEPNAPDMPMLPYYPRYDQIQPDQRARYLEWLSTGRGGKLDEIGYAFLFFYGLERRLLIEKQGAEIIVPEVKRLLDRYPHSSSFTTYLGNFLAYHAASQIETLTAEHLSEIFPDLLDLSEEATKATLAWHSHNQQPLPWQLAYSTAFHFSEQRIPSALKKDRYNLALLFSQRYRSQFGAGIITVASKRPYKMAYRAASPNLIGYYATERTIRPVAIPNPLGRASQFNTLFSLWESCIQELRPFSTQIAKTGGELSRQAYQCLPVEIKALTLHPDKGRWDTLYRKDATDSGSAIIPISVLAELIEIEQRDRLTPGQSRTLNQTANDAGYQVLPDIRLAGRPYLWDESVVLVPLGDRADRGLTTLFESTALMLELGLGIAASDGTIDPAELDHLRSVIDITSNLTPFEQTCIRALERLLVLSPPSLTGLGERLKKSLSPDERMKVAQYLVDIATIDKNVDTAERKALGRIFKAMDIAESQLIHLLKAAFHPEPDEQPVTVLNGGPWLAGEAIPPPPEVIDSFFIDTEKVNLIQRETIDVKNILIGVLSSEDEDREVNPSDEGEAGIGKEEEKETESDTSNSPSGAFNDLLPRYVPVLQDLMTSDFWTQSDFQELVKTHQCMPGSTVDAINSWSEELHEDCLIEEEDGGFRINRQLLNT